MPGDLFAAALAFTLPEEGLWSDDKEDAGGPTWKGITLPTLRHWRDDQSVTAAQLRAMPDGEVNAIYRMMYWNALHAGSLAPGVGLACFDCGVNCGVQRAAKMLQACLGVNQDGDIGPITLTAAGRAQPSTLLRQFARAREAYYRGLDGFSHDGNGWLTRNAACLQAALVAAGGSASPVLTA